jgi:putative transcriptional regulator
MHDIFWIHDIGLRTKVWSFFMDRKITFKIDKVLKQREQSLYWLARTTGISYTTLWRLTKERAVGMNFATLEKMCVALECEPGDLINFERQKKGTSKTREIARPSRRASSVL